MLPDHIDIRRPTTTFRGAESAPIFNLDRPIAGLRVGIRTDELWYSWPRIAQRWAEMLRADGAEPVLLEVHDRASEDDAKRTCAALDAWGADIDCAVVGLAN